ncbi:unnamed protein product [Dibothriocephalus latus]|uniref:Aquaporin n=1 Tax=Dibothriocephalus latus TaxID=60516 RepID=A0A3P7KXQ6_DIBLA|nr:unnamed protein product [Dibothriocephalus latus]
MLVFLRPSSVARPPLLPRTQFPQQKDAGTQTDAVAEKVDPVNQSERQSIVTRTWRILRIWLAELLGTGLLSFVCVRTKTHAAITGDLPSALMGPLALIMGTWLSGPVSGGHVNPAVTLTMTLCRTLSPMYLPLYWSSQLAGACAGTALAFAMNETSMSRLGNHTVEFGNADKTQIISELSASTMFLLNVLSGGDNKRPDSWMADAFTNQFHPYASYVFLKSGLAGEGYFNVTFYRGPLCPHLGIFTPPASFGAKFLTRRHVTHRVALWFENELLP